jgi:hypothetical protein
MSLLPDAIAALDKRLDDLEGAPPGAGDMLAATYDPTSVVGDAFDMENMVEGATNKILTGTERTKLSGIATGAEVNVNADWASGAGDSQILNKPTLGTAAAHADTDFATAGHNHTGVYQPAATGTPDGTKYLRDDNSWQAVAGGSGLSHPQVLARGLGA